MARDHDTGLGGSRARPHLEPLGRLRGTLTWYSSNVVLLLVGSSEALAVDVDRRAAAYWRIAAAFPGKEKWWVVHVMSR